MPRRISRCVSGATFRSSRIVKMNCGGMKTPYQPPIRYALPARPRAADGTGETFRWGVAGARRQAQFPTVEERPAVAVRAVARPRPRRVVLARPRADNADLRPSLARARPPFARPGDRTRAA